MAATEFTFAHLADAHVGAWPRDPSVRRALRESVLKALEVVSDRGCEFLLISGDLFHTPVPDPAEAAPVAAALRRLTDEGRRIYAIYGSHDYVAHRTSWLDVLAESGLFLRVAPAPVRAEGERWTLPFVLDAPTGCRIAGISGRAQGLDRAYFLGVDSEAFRAEPGFKIFQFHAAVQEYLPEQLRAHIQGISVEDLPGGVDYYAGGHIHASYSGPGPHGEGLLVNPGALFGTSVTDLDLLIARRAQRGLALVTVRRGSPTVEFVDTAPKDLRRFDVDVEGATAEEAKARIGTALERHKAPGALLFPRIHGTLADGSVGALGLRRPSETGDEGASAVHWDVAGVLDPAPEEDGGGLGGEELERTILARLAKELPPAVADPVNAEALLLDLLHELGRGPSEGESKTDYQVSRIEAARALLARGPARVD